MYKDTKGYLEKTSVSYSPTPDTPREMRTIEEINDFARENRGRLESVLSSLHQIHYNLCGHVASSKASPDATQENNKLAEVESLSTTREIIVETGRILDEIESIVLFLFKI